MPALEDLLSSKDLQKITSQGLDSSEEPKKIKPPIKKPIPLKEKTVFRDRGDYDTYKKVQLNTQAQKVIDAIIENQNQKEKSREQAPRPPIEDAEIPKPPIKTKSPEIISLEEEIAKIQKEKEEAIESMLREKAVKITEKDFNLVLLGTPCGFDMSFVKNFNYQDLNFYQAYYNRDKRNTVFKLTRAEITEKDLENSNQWRKGTGKDKIIYTFLKYNFLDSNSRGNAFFGISLELIERYCTDPQKLQRLFEKLFEEIIIKKYQLVEKINDPQYTHKFKIEDFKKDPKAIHAIAEIKDLLIKNFQKAFAEDFRKKDTEFVKNINYPYFYKTLEPELYDGKKSSFPPNFFDFDRNKIEAEYAKKIEAVQEKLKKLTSPENSGENKIEITDQNFKFQLFGTPETFSLAGFSEKEKTTYEKDATFYQMFDDGGKEDKTFKIYKKKDGRTIYIYKKNNLLTNSGRGGGFLAMAVELNQINCTNPQKLYRLLDSVFEVFFKEGGYFLSGNKINVNSFEGQEEKIKKLKDIIQRNLNNFSAEELNSVEKTETPENIEAPISPEKKQEISQAPIEKQEKGEWTAEDEKTLQEIMSAIDELGGKMSARKQEIEKLKEELKIPLTPTIDTNYKIKPDWENAEPIDFEEISKKEEKEIGFEPLKNIEGKLFSIPEADGSFKMDRETPDIAYYKINQNGDVYFINEEGIKRAINRMGSYLKPIFEIEGTTESENKNGFIIKKLPKIDPVNGKLLEKGLIELVYEKGFFYKIEKSTTKREGTRNEGKKVEGYLKGKTGKFFNRLENSTENSFFKLFNVKDDIGFFEFHGDEDEAIANRIFSGDYDVFKVIRGSEKTATSVVTKKPGKIRKIDDKWEVIEPTEIELL